MSRSATNLLASIVAVLALTTAPVRADDPGVAFFEKKVRPVLVEHCYKCHSTEAKKLGGGLLLDSRDGVRKGGESGTAVEPGRPDDSLLIKAVRYTDDVAEDAAEGEAARVGRRRPGSLGEERRARPARRAAPRDGRRTVGRDAAAPARLVEPEAGPDARRARRPKNAAWSEQPVDRFILARLEAAGARRPPGRPTRARSRRRLSLVLTGLPPTPEQVERFVAERRGRDGTAAGRRAGWSTRCSRRPISASAGPGTGWTWSGSRRRTATSGTTRSITPGATAIT